jgi:hypothetical protein
MVIFFYYFILEKLFYSGGIGIFFTKKLLKENVNILKSAIKYLEDNL